jgi:hypothetical protein
MQTVFKKQRDFIYTFNLPLSMSNDVILKELQQEQWTPDQAGYAQNSFPTRYRLTHPKNNALIEIQNWIDHSDFKNEIIDQLYQESLFPGHWGISQQRMMEKTFIYGIYTLDKPGYSIRIHTDDRLHVVQGMIYFIPTDDPKRSTTFYTSFEGNNPMRIPTGPGAGYVAANLSTSWHTGENSSNEDRYSLIFGIRLNL